MPKTYDYPIVTSATGGGLLLGSENKKIRNYPVSAISDYVLSNFPTSASNIFSPTIDLPLTFGLLPFSRLSAVPTVSISGDGLMTSAMYSKFRKCCEVPNKLILLSGQQITNSVGMGDMQEFDRDFNYVVLHTTSPVSGSYQAEVYFYTTEDNINPLLVAQMTMTPSTNDIFVTVISDNTKWMADVVVTSGVVPVPGITARVLI